MKSVRDFIVANPIWSGAILLSGLMGLVATIFWWKEISYNYPGPARVALSLMFVILITGLVISTLTQRANDLQTEKDNLSQENEQLSAEIDNLRGRTLNYLPRLIGLEVLANRWQTFNKEKLDIADSEIMYEQILITQQLFAGEPQIIFKKSFPGNKPTKSAFLVQVQSVQVLKFDHLENLRKERDRFADCVQVRLSQHTPGKPVAFWPPESTWDRTAGNERGAILYDLTQMGRTDPQTFGNYYENNDTNAVVEVLRKLLMVLAPSWSNPPGSGQGWWDNPIHRNQGHKCPRRNANPGEYGLYYEYKRLIEKFGAMNTGLQKALADCNLTLNITEDGQLFHLEGISLPNRDLIHYPLSWVQNVFGSLNDFNARYGYLDNPGDRRDSIIHGDLHMGNILVEEDQGPPTIWLIDFPHTHIGPTVQDIARLEADLKFALFSRNLLADYAVFERVLAFEDEILGDGTRQSLDLSDRLRSQASNVSAEVDAELDKVWQALTILRRPVRARNLILDDAKFYYLALVHSTLPMLYYRDRTPWQKLYAFISAALLCERLGG
jgi:hypothetical protein